MRKLLVAAVIAAPIATAFATPASAYCDPKYWPLCINDCHTELPDPKDPLGTIVRMCPA